jgi:antitoxin PrlF
VKKFDFSDFSEKYKYLETLTGMRTSMAKKNSNCGCNSQDSEFECSPGAGFRVESVLSVDERGQMVLPKDIREKAGIKTGDKLALISWEKNGSICCLALMKVENLSGMVKEVLGPLMHDTNS